MKIDVTQAILGLDGEPFADLTLRKMCAEALQSGLPGDDKMEQSKKSAMGLLALRIQFKRAVDLQSEEISQLKSRISTCYVNAVLVQRACNLLEGKPNVVIADDDSEEEE